MWCGHNTRYTNIRQKVSALTQKKHKKLTEILTTYARYTSHGITNITGISEGSARIILKINLGVSRKTAHWIPHLLTNEQKLERIKIAKKMLKMIANFGLQIFINNVTGDESYAHFLNLREKQITRYGTPEKLVESQYSEYTKTMIKKAKYSPHI